MLIKTVKCDICGRTQEDLGENMAYYEYVFFSDMVGIPNRGGRKYDLCIDCSRKYLKELESISKHIDNEFLLMKIKETKDKR